jgi:hypothetical protein
MRTLGLEPTLETSQKLAQGLKNLRMGDLFELELSERLAAEAVKVEGRMAAAPTASARSNH